MQTINYKFYNDIHATRLITELDSIGYTRIWSLDLENDSFIVVYPNCEYHSSEDGALGGKVVYLDENYKGALALAKKNFKRVRVYSAPTITIYELKNENLLWKK